jgi:hypothetical protein
MGSTLRAATVFGIVCCLGSVAAGDPARATVLMDDADKAFKGASCGNMATGGCADPAAFTAAVRGYAEALALDPRPQNAARACRAFTNSQKNERASAVADGTVWRLIAFCDYGARHPDSDATTRDRSRAGSEYRRWLHDARSEADRDARIDAAARALFGAGLAVTHDKASGAITIDAGKLEGRLVQEYTAELWAEYVGKIDTSPSGFAAWSAYLTPEHAKAYTAAKDKGALGWALLEPAEKLSACALMTKKMTADAGKRTLASCVVAAMLEANAPRYAYRGAPASHAAADGVGLARDERVFLPGVDGVYPTVITVASPVAADSYAGIQLQGKLASGLYRGGDQPKEVAALVARGQKIAKAKEAAFAVADKKLGKKGKVIVFAAAPFVGWELPKILGKKDTAECSRLHYKAYAPASGSDEAEIAVDGAVCTVTSLSSLDGGAPNTEAVAQAIDTPISTECVTALATPGEHAISIGMFKVETARTGRLEITSDLKIRDESLGVRGKLATKAAITCTTK